MPITDRQIAQFAAALSSEVPFDTSPRYLAGPGEARHVTHGLAAAGWQRTSDPLDARIDMASRDLRHHLRYDPVATACWQIRAEWAHPEPGWHAAFSDLVPAEILAGVTDALVLPSPESGQPDPLGVLDRAGWLIDARGAASSQDAACRVERQIHSGLTTWRVQVKPPLHERGLVWSAAFDPFVPARLVAAFAAALADAAPVQRGMHAPTGHHSVTQTRSVRTPEQVVAAHTTRLTAIAAQTRRRAHAPAAVTAAAPARRRS